MDRVPRGYVLMPVQALGSPTSSPLRRIVVLLGIVGILFVGFLRSPLVTNADTLQGTGTNGACITVSNSLTLFSGSVVGVGQYGISFKLEMWGYPTVAQATWAMTNGTAAPARYWQTVQASPYANGAGFSGYVNQGVAFSPGSSGTASYAIHLLGYVTGVSCFKVSDVRIERYWSAPGATSIPGGGGLAPTPTPAVTPTVPPAATPIPGATQGAGTVCYFNASTFAQDCMPSPPSGWCYVEWPGCRLPACRVQCRGDGSTRKHRASVVVVLGTLVVHEPGRGREYGHE